MKKSLFIFFGVILMTTACAHGSQKRSFTDVIDDSVLHARLKAKFLTDKTIKPGDLKITVRQGVVTLNGELDNQAEIDRAIETAERTKGVNQVKAYLLLKEQKDAGIILQSKNKSRPESKQQRNLREENLTPDKDVSNNTKPKASTPQQDDELDDEWEYKIP